MTAQPVLDRPDTTPVVGPPERVDDVERMAHIVYPADKLTDAMVFGTPVQALCGKTWVPNRDPERFPVCQTCVEVFEETLGRPWPGRR